MLCFHICLQTRHGKNRYKLRQFCNSETEYRKEFGEFCLKIQKYCLKTSQPAIASLRCCCRLCRQGGEEVGLASQPLLSAVTLPSATLSTPCRASHQYQVHSGPVAGSSQGFVGQIRGKLPKSHLPRAMQSDTENMVELR